MGRDLALRLPEEVIFSSKFSSNRLFLIHPISVGRTDSGGTPESSVGSDRPVALDLAQARGDLAQLRSTNIKLASEALDVQLVLEEKDGEIAKNIQERDNARDQAAGRYRFSFLDLQGSIPSPLVTVPSFSFSSKTCGP